MMRFFTLFIIIFSVSGTVWSMWLSSELKNDDIRLEIIKNKNFYLKLDNLRSILILANSNSSLAFPFKIFPDGSLSF